MDYQEFSKLIYEQIKENLPEHLKHAEVEFSTIQNLNSVPYNVASIKLEQDVVAPRFYMDKYYEDYQRGRSLDDIAGEMVDLYLSKENNITQGIPGQFMDYSQIKEQLMIQLINKETNEELLKNHPHKEMENTNLAAVYRVKVSEDEHGISSFMVTQNMMNYWGISADSIYQDALASAMKLEPVQLTGMEETMMRIMGLDVEPINSQGKLRVEESELCVLSNTSSHWGASVLLYPELLQQIADNSEVNLFILPSSIHEVLLLGDTGQMNAEELQAMVISINHQEVLPEEVLSNEVYYFDREEHTLSMATSREKTAELMKQFGSSEQEYETERDDFLER